MKLAFGTDDFKKLQRMGGYFVDKSLFIFDVLEDGSEVLLFPRPRRFGKTINMSMLAAFLELDVDGRNRALFDDLLISEKTEFCQLHQGRYPVIFISFKSVKHTSYSACRSAMSELISQAYRAHKHLVFEALEDHEKAQYQAILEMKSDDAFLEKSLLRLSEYLHRATGQPVVILIDEYDTPFQAGYLNDYYEKVVDFSGSVLANALKGNPYLRKGVLTGITRIAQAGVFSGLNNIEVHTVLDKGYAGYFGFTETEVEKLIFDTESSVSIDGLKRWYNGYQVGDSTLYNPWSIVSCVKRNSELRPYWVNTSDNTLVEFLISTSDPDVKLELECLLQGETIEKPLAGSLTYQNLTYHDEESLWTLLVYAGYLTACNQDVVLDEPYRLKIPNREVGYVFSQLVKAWFIKSKPSISFYQKFVDSFVNEDFEVFEHTLSEYISQSASFFDFSSNPKEQVFHCFVLGLVVGMRENYVIQSNRESGFGRFDMIFIPKEKSRAGIIMEFKMADDRDDLERAAHNAIDQIIEKNYSAAFSQHDIERYVSVGVAFYQKFVKVVTQTANNSIKKSRPKPG